MSDYKRLVAYIYLYEGGQRAKNVGFAKVEARNGDCRILVHIKGIRMEEDKECAAYIFCRKKEGLKGIFIGSFIMKNGAGELKTVTKALNLMGTGQRLSDMSGIIIQAADGRMFATRWDDAPLELDSFQMYDEEELVVAAEVADEEEPELQVTEFTGDRYVMVEPSELLKHGEAGRRLVNNSFVLHGYYNYDHLLMKYKGNDAVMLGIPGEFCMQEKMMAALFGFPEFQILDEYKRDSKNTGYWLRRLDYGPAGKIHESSHRSGQKGI